MSTIGLLFGPPLRAQTVDAAVTGQVLDEETEAPLAGAHVFLEGSTYGAVTDADGRFRLSGFSPGTYSLVASIVGYEAASLGLRLSGLGGETVRVLLPPRVIELDQVEVVGRKPEGWDARLERFKRLFIGESEWARETSLLNPERLWFDEADGAFTAWSEGPLLLENRGLGYRLTYVLDEFAETREAVRYRGRVGFEELEPRNGRERRRWRRAREEVYEGSLRHLLSMLAAGEREEEFELYLVAEPEPFEFIDRDRLGRETVPGHPVDPASVVTHQGRDYVLRFAQYLCVVYMGEAARISSSYPGARTAERLYEREVSWIGLDAEHRAGAVFDAGGRLHDPYAVHVFGVMGGRRMAELLPWDYRP